MIPVALEHTTLIRTQVDKTDSPWVPAYLNYLQNPVSAGGSFPAPHSALILRLFLDLPPETAPHTGQSCPTRPCLPLDPRAALPPTPRVLTRIVPDKVLVEGPQLVPSDVSGRIGRRLEVQVIFAITMKLRGSNIHANDNLFCVASLVDGFLHQLQGWGWNTVRLLAERVGKEE